MSKYIIFSTAMFIIGSFGVFLVKRHIIIILISFEIMLLSITINFVIFSIFLDDLVGQLYAIMVLTVAASESAIGLAILIVYYRLRGGISLELVSLLKS